ncbi:hypothetical protein [Paraglaciecola hydrolytica]|uniref:Uncharacterized protein n=1 Tax=Paraglaciecola hydrolytica TaxID=1799789 RepID=A0A135ZZ10_9ALTE|nr:hypothetical protein [Paraglaciecola hydrolytica]KXI28219.1 hypothetical protein AX660_17730 [Paraglaciecola hydrolytica]
MHNQPSYDTSSQAMTEVALGLSMAFFALLIVALLSVQMPSQNKELKVKQVDKVATDDSQKVQIKEANKQAKTTSAVSDTQFIFFYQGRFIDQQLQPVVLSRLQTATPVVLAVEQTLSFAEVINIRHKINHPSLSITLLTQEWQNLLEQQP